MMFSRVACPYCYQRINPARLAFQCAGKGVPGKPGCPPLKDDRRAELTGYSLPCYPVFPATGWAAATSRKAPCPNPECCGLTGIRACPQCHTPLSYGFAESNSPLLGMVGGKGAGKTVYLAVLNHELHKSIRRRFGADIRLAGDQQPVGLAAASPRAWIDSYETALFDRHTLPSGTQAAIDGRRIPLVVEWRREVQRLGRKHFATTVLSFYDAAGEDFVTQGGTHAQAYLGVADGLIVLLDPWQLPGLAHAIDVPEEVRKGAERPLDVLNRITEMLRTTHSTSSRKLLTTPLAVVFAKMDALFPMLDEEHPLMRAPTTVPGYDEVAGKETHEHVAALLAKYEADDIDAHLRLNYKNFQYFAVSALGAPPNYQTNAIDGGGIRPFRVDEPLLWLLSRNRFGVVDRIEP